MANVNTKLPVNLEDDIELSLDDNERLLLLQLSQVNNWEQKIRSAKFIEAKSKMLNAPIERQLPNQWHLLGDYVLYGWQKVAAERWFKNDQRGIIKVVTGAGKTVLTLGIIQQLQNNICPELRVLIVVPTIVLASQWINILADQSNLPESAVVMVGGAGGKDPAINGNTRIIVAVINSASTKLRALLDKISFNRNLLLVVDECHRAGAQARRRLFDIERRFSLGLSATPERNDSDLFDLENAELDSATRNLSGDEVLLKELGPIIFEMNYAEAVRDEVLSPFLVQHYGLMLTSSERRKYEQLSRDITDLRRSLETRTLKGLALIRWCRSPVGQANPQARQLIILTTQRKSLVYQMKERRAAVKKLVTEALKTNPDARIIVFHESINHAMSIFNMLRKDGFPVVAEHSDLPDQLRAESIKLFRLGVAKIIVSVKSLIEGFDVPSADVGIIAAASASVRQRIQSLGRLLRPNPNKGVARLIVLYASNTVDEFIYERADWEEFLGPDRNQYFSWTDVNNTSPVEVSHPPRSPLKADAELDVSDLNIGDHYPGVLEGQSYSIDMQGIAYDEGNQPHIPSSKLRRLLHTYVKKGGRITITPRKKFILTSEKTGESSDLIYLGIAPEPLFEQTSKDRSPNGPDSEIGKEFHGIVGTTVKYYVLQRDRRLIAKKVKGKAKFIVPPEHIDDLSMASKLKSVLDHLRSAYSQGRKMSKILLTSKGDVLYPFNGTLYFAGNLGERLVFED